VHFTFRGGTIISQTTGDTKTLQRDSLHTVVECTAASPGPAGTWERSTHSILLVNIVSEADIVTFVEKLYSCLRCFVFGDFCE